MVKARVLMVLVAVSFSSTMVAGDFLVRLRHWGEENRKRRIDSIKMLLHYAMPSKFEGPVPLNPEEAGDQDVSFTKDKVSADGHTFGYQKEVSDRFSSHFVGKRPDTLDDLLAYFGNIEGFKAAGVEEPRGLLLHGPPGTGKTTIARVIAGEAGLEFIYLTGSDFSNKYYGEGGKSVHALFRCARECARKSGKPVVLLIDEIDSVGLKRKDDGNQEDRKTLNTLLTELTDPRNDKIFVTGATNHLEALDPAFLRRFTYHEKIDLPSADQRKDIFNFYLGNKKCNLACANAKHNNTNCACDTPFKRILKKMEKNGCSGENKSFSGSDIKNLVNLAATRAFVTKSDVIIEEHFNKAYEKISQKNAVTCSVGEQAYRLLWRAPFLGDALNGIYNLRKEEVK